MSKEEAHTLASEIAQHIDQIMEGIRNTAVVEAREGEAAPHIAIVITVNPRFIPKLLEFCQASTFARHNPETGADSRGA
jgi:hypothetical protein